MFGGTRTHADQAAHLDALDLSQAGIEFQPNGTILIASGNFLSAMGYTLPEVQGRHHGVFVEPAYRDSAKYQAFCDALRRGTFQAAEFKRVAKGGRDVWIQASCNPFTDADGTVLKVVKFAAGITAQVHERQRRAEAKRATSTAVVASEVKAPASRPPRSPTRSGCRSARRRRLGARRWGRSVRSRARSANWTRSRQRSRRRSRSSRP